MKQLTLYYATNRKHANKGDDDRWHPNYYTGEFSKDGTENLRFGKLAVEVDQAEMKERFEKKLKGLGVGDGENLCDYLTDCARSASIVACEEKLEKGIPDDFQVEESKMFGSSKFFDQLKNEMLASKDVLIYIHGYNVDWYEAVGQALALQQMLRFKMGVKDYEDEKVMVVLFSWPSDGSLMPWVAYASDRSDARNSGAAVGRAFLKLRDYLRKLRIEHKKDKEKNKLCNQEIHLLCHSMGNYLLENVLIKMKENPPYGINFKNIFLCAPDVDDDVLEKDNPLDLITRISESVTVYHNRGDVALKISDLTKKNPDRLGTAGVARPKKLHQKVQQVDCTPIVSGVIEHGYFLSGKVVEDICRSIANVPQDDPNRDRQKLNGFTNLWKMV